MNATKQANVYIAKGWQVICLSPREKVPHGEFSPRGAYSSTADLEQVAKWPKGCNIGVRCGPVSRLVVLDLDSPEAWARVEANFGEVEKTLQSGTGRGTHHWYTLPDDMTDEISFSPCLDVDVKAGGYVVAPPSIHPSGKQYQFDEAMAFDGELYVEDCPAWLLDLIRRKSFERARVKKQVAATQAHFCLIPEKVIWKAIHLRRWTAKRCLNGACRHHAMLALARRLYANGCNADAARGVLVEFALDVEGIKSRRITTKEIDDAIAWAFSSPPEVPDNDILLELYLAMRSPANG
jgi:hypothetical protein